MMQENVKFVAIARSEDRKIIVSHIQNPSDPDGSKYTKSITDVLNAPAWASVKVDGKLSLNCEPNTFHLTADDRKNAFVVVTNMDYPTRLVFQMIKDMQKAYKERKNGDNVDVKKLRKDFQALSEQYNNPASIDKISKIRDKVDNAKGVMQDNLKLALKNTENIDNLGNKAEDLNQRANMFKGQAVHLKRKMQWRYYKLQCLTFLLVFVVVGYIALPFIDDA
eukprot:TRINITY_DN4654_c1_g1_i1.p1 TRINITY_DN4654_c1_g1~~TRINITY_DN4654_c1_g1_i1.p1  ORF type:complete len:222 (+),score=59.62 TRINITY_DN4654_c1_g1_i1:142-807(+)